MEKLLHHHDDSTLSMHMNENYTYSIVGDLLLYQGTQLTLTEAALAIAGLNPFSNSLCTLRFATPFTQELTHLMLHWLRQGVATYKLNSIDLWIFNDLNSLDSCNYNEFILKLQRPLAFKLTPRHINPSQTTVYAEDAQIYLGEYHREAIAQLSERHEASKAAKHPLPPKQQTIVKVEYQHYKPKHENIEWEIATEMMMEIYDKCEAGNPDKRPPKSLETEDMIKEKLQRRGIAEPNEAQIKRIDKLARPLCFKHTQG